MSITDIKPTFEEIDQAKQLYKDVNDYLEYLTDIIQTKVQEYEESDDPDDEELSPTVSNFLNDYKEYISSLPQVHTQLVNSNSSSPSSSTRKRFLRYSQLPPPDLISDLQKLCEAKIDRSVQISPSFSTSLPTLDNINNEKLLTNETSPSVTFLKAQLEKCKREQEKNRIVIHVPKYSYYDELIEPVEERKVVFVVKKSTAVIVAPPTVVEPPKEQEPIKEETEDKNSTIEDEKSKVAEVSEKVSEKNVKSKIDFDFLFRFLSSTKVGFSRSHLSSLVLA